MITLADAMTTLEEAGVDEREMGKSQSPAGAPVNSANMSGGMMGHNKKSYERRRYGLRQQGRQDKGRAVDYSFEQEPTDLQNVLNDRPESGLYGEAERKRVKLDDKNYRKPYVQQTNKRPFFSNGFGS